MSTRRSYLRWLPAALVPMTATGQHPVGADDFGLSSKFNWPWGKEKPINNQCPMCGAMAKPARQPTYASQPKNCHGVKDHPYLVECDPTENIPYGPTSLLARCQRCNNAFFQDTEPIK